MGTSGLTAASYLQSRKNHWDKIARKIGASVSWGGAYHRRLIEVFRFWVAPGQRILEVGCEQGDLLAALRPARGVGVDFSSEMLRHARQSHPDIEFVEADGHDLEMIERPFDIIILSDLIDDLWDVQMVLEQIKRLCHHHTRIIINSHSRVWEPLLFTARKLKVAKPMLPQNWLTVEDVSNLLNLSGFEVIRSWEEVLWPLRTPFINQLCNKCLVKVWPFKLFAMTNFIMARPCPEKPLDNHLVSVIVAARNEAGNIAQIFTRTPEMGAGTELVFVEGHSQDDTYSAIEREIAAHPERKSQLHRQEGVGKGDAVRLGFAKAKGDVLMILDADMTVPPEDLPRFYEALRSGRGEFINGVRLVYPMEKDAMRVFNFLGNKFFSLAFSWLLGQPIKDTLCGTKVLTKQDYALIAANRQHFGDFDPFGDYDLIFGAAKLGLKMIDLPIRYRARTYGSTNIQRWSHGWLLLRMVTFAAKRIKFT
ncbi:MAG: glycosyltransferase [Deltaproteobacteria bacterium]|nr:glycosyltransferase [Deltaproteobacteria bacterium]MCX5855413.1 glycosyltransferase [Deltaproteobacteria bacterium]